MTVNNRPAAEGQAHQTEATGRYSGSQSGMTLTQEHESHNAEVLEDRYIKLGLLNDNLLVSIRRLYQVYNFGCG